MQLDGSEWELAQESGASGAAEPRFSTWEEVLGKRQAQQAQQQRGESGEGQEGGPRMKGERARRGAEGRVDDSHLPLPLTLSCTCCCPS